MAKKIRNRPDPPAARRQGDARAARRHRAGPARHQHRRVQQDLQRADGRPERPDHPRPDHHLRGPQLHLHPQDPARGRPAAQGGRRREGLARPPAARRSARSPAPRSARSPRSRWPTSTPSTSRRRLTHHRGHGPLDGHRGRRLATHQPVRAQPASCTVGPSLGRPARPPRVDRGRPSAGPHGGTRPMPQHGKRYQELAKLVDRDRGLRAGRGMPTCSRRPADGQVRRHRVEAHIRLGVDPRHADQMVRGTVVLPHGTGKTVRVVVFAQGDKAQEALRGRRRRGRWRGPGQAHRGRLARLRRRARDARHDGHGRQARAASSAGAA